MSTVPGTCTRAHLLNSHNHLVRPFLLLFPFYRPGKCSVSPPPSPPRPPPLQGFSLDPGTSTWQSENVVSPLQIPSLRPFQDPAVPFPRK